jgi:anti-sigma B factor antagonist
VNMDEEQVGTVTVLIPRGDMDITTLPAFEARVAALINSGTHALIWDLSQVGFLPSTAAGFLLQTARRMRAGGGPCVLAGASQRVLGTLRTMGVLQLFPVYDDREVALKALAS